MDPHKLYEIRCPVHGFIKFDDWERTIINEPAFQRLRRIRQLAWTDYVYPGAMHTRFEHSLGVMHTATLLYDGIVERSRGVLSRELGYNDTGLQRHRKLVRLAALLHDVGHAPFSHAGEEHFPVDPQSGVRYKHEAYSAALIRNRLRSAIENHPLNANCGFTADEIAALLEGRELARLALFWRELIDGQMDADRMDYLQRDSLHAGVRYGRYDFDRMLNTMVAVPGGNERAPRLGITEGGWHAAESLVLARYAMFTQVYFHKTRVACDIHLRGALDALLPGGQFPPPTPEQIDEYLDWHDWRVLGHLAAGDGGEHAERLAARNHFRCVYQTREVLRERDQEELAEVRVRLGDRIVAEEPAHKSWYKTGQPDIPVLSETVAGRVSRLSEHSCVVAGLKPSQQILVYVRPDDAESAARDIASLQEGDRDEN